MFCMKYDIWKRKKEEREEKEGEKKEHSSGIQNLILKDMRNVVHGFLSD